jgi:hypothetical protein
MTSLSFDVLQWKNINSIVHKTMVFLRKPYPADVTNFLNWYQSIEQKPMLVSLSNTKLKKWLIDGIPYMKRIVVLMNGEIKNLDKMLTNIYKMQLSAPEKINYSKVYYDGIKNILETIVEFLGCRNKFGQWYINLLRAYGNDPTIKANINFFQDTCMEDRQRLLKY